MKPPLSLWGSAQGRSSAMTGQRKDSEGKEEGCYHAKLIPTEREEGNKRGRGSKTKKRSQNNRTAGGTAPGHDTGDCACQARPHRSSQSLS